MDTREALEIITQLDPATVVVESGDRNWPSAIIRAAVVATAENDQVMFDRLREAIAHLTGLPISEKIDSSIAMRAANTKGR